MDDLFESWLTARGHDLEAVAGTAELADLDREFKGMTRAFHRALDDATGPRRDRVEALGAAAAEGGWDARRLDLELLRGSRADAPLPLGRGAGSAQLVEAGLCLSLGLSPAAAAKHYGAQVTDAATAKGYRDISIQGVIKAVLAAHGRPVPPGRLGDSHIREAFELAPRASGVSTITVPGILGAVANKLALQGFTSAATVWQLFSNRSSVSDFKERTAYRMTMTGAFEEVAANAGEIKHASLTESSYTNQARTYGRMIGISRTDIINDDLGSLQNLAPALGRMSSVAVERAVFTRLLDNASFFTSGNANVSTGAGSALSIAGLNAATATFTKQVDPNGDPIMIDPEVLLAPPTLYATARSLMNSDGVIDATTGQEVDGNPWRQLATPVTSAYMEDATLTGNSTTAWYLLSGPGPFAVIDVAFLRGVETPTIETADLDFRTLGIQMRGYLDFGVGFLEPRGGVRSAGT